jgi:hypothetical protein
MAGTIGVSTQRGPLGINADPVKIITLPVVSGAVATATGALRWYNDTGSDLTVLSTRASVGTAPTGATLIVDINMNGTTIFTTQASRPAIAISGNTAQGATPDVVTITSGSYLTYDVDQVGSGTAGSNLVVQLAVVAAS